MAPRDRSRFQVHSRLSKKRSRGKSGDVDNAIEACIANIHNAIDQLKAINDVKGSAAQMKTDYAAEKIPDYGKLNVVVVKLSSNASTVQGIGSSVSTCMSSLKKIGVGL